MQVVVVQHSHLSNLKYREITSPGKPLTHGGGSQCVKLAPFCPEEHTFYQAPVMAPWNLVACVWGVASFRCAVPASLLPSADLHICSAAGPAFSGCELHLLGTRAKMGLSDIFTTEGRSCLLQRSFPMSQLEPSLMQEVVFPAWNMDIYRGTLELEMGSAFLYQKTSVFVVLVFLQLQWSQFWDGRLNRNPYVLGSAADSFPGKSNFDFA